MLLPLEFVDASTATKVFGQNASTGTTKRLKDEDEEDLLQEGGNVPEEEEGLDNAASKITNGAGPWWNGGLWWKRLVLLVELSGPYFRSSRPGRRYLMCVLILTGLKSAVSVLFSYVTKDLWNALNEQNVPLFKKVLIRYVIILALGTVVRTYDKYNTRQMAIHWRHWMTNQILHLYQAVYYYPWSSSTTTNTTTTTTTTTTMDNPDQRMAQDVETFTTYSLQLATSFLNSGIDLISFCTILWNIYPRLFVVIILYATMGTWIITHLGHALVQFNVIQLHYEANLRYSLMRWRDHAESIAFLNAGAWERRSVQVQLHSVVHNQQCLNQTQAKVECFTIAYHYFIQIAPLAVLAPPYFHNNSNSNNNNNNSKSVITLGVLSQAVGVFNHILSDLSVFMDQWEHIASFVASMDRLGRLLEVMRIMDPNRRNETTNGPLLPVAVAASSTTSANKTNIDTTTTSTIYESLQNQDNNPNYDTILLTHRTTDDDHVPTDPILSIRDLTLFTPSTHTQQHQRRRLLIQGLTLDILAGHHLLIVGDSGVGKSTLLRAMAGLLVSSSGTGYIHVNAASAAKSISFVPQRPYWTLGGTLLEQIVYPNLLVDEDYGDTNFTDRRPIIMGQDDAILDTTTAATASSATNNSSVNDEQLVLDILDQVGLSHIAQTAGHGNVNVGLHTVLDWTHVLSLGEQQRLALARVLYQQPQLVVLDEATSALDLPAEACMYQKLLDMSLHTGMTILSVGHRPSLVPYHKKRLALGIGPNHCSYELQDI